MPLSAPLGDAPPSFVQSLFHRQTNAVRAPALSVAGQRTHRTLRWMRFGALLFLLFFFKATLVHGKRTTRIRYLPSPRLAWTVSLGDNAVVQQGNAVSYNQQDDRIYITSRDGSVHVRSAGDGAEIRTVPPHPVEALTLSTDDNRQVRNVWTTTCASAVQFAQLSDGTRFLVYALLDTPNETAVIGVRSRLVAYTLPNLQLMWVSSNLPGQIQGTPQYIADPAGGEGYIAITRNEKYVVGAAQSTTFFAGHFTLLSASTGQIVWGESEASVEGRAGTTQGFSPLQVAQQPSMGKYDGGIDNTNDIAVFASRGSDGSSNNGYTFAFQLPAHTDGDVHNPQKWTARILKSVRWTSITRPTLSRDGLSLFIGVSKSELRGWTAMKRFDETADWKANVAENKRDRSTAMQTPPTLSNNETKLYASSISGNLVCFDVETKEEQWNLQAESPFLAELVASPDGERLYGIQSGDGTLLIVTDHSGEYLLWSSCDDDEPCSSSVYADFSLSTHGDTLYYADTSGILVAVKLGTVATSDDGDRVDGTQDGNGSESDGSNNDENGGISHGDNNDQVDGTGDSEGGDMTENQGTTDSTFNPTPSPTELRDPSADFRIPEKPLRNDGGRDSTGKLAKAASVVMIILASLVCIAAALYVAKINRIKTFPQPKDDENPIAFEVGPGSLCIGVEKTLGPHEKDRSKDLESVGVKDAGNSLCDEPLSDSDIDSDTDDDGDGDGDNDNSVSVCNIHRDGVKDDGVKDGVDDDDIKQADTEDTLETFIGHSPLNSEPYDAGKDKRFTNFDNSRATDYGLGAAVML